MKQKPVFLSLLPVRRATVVSGPHAGRTGNVVGGWGWFGLRFTLNVPATEEEIRLRYTEGLPEDWDGVELRHYIAGMAKDQVGNLKMPKERQRRFENAILVLNL